MRSPRYLPGAMFRPGLLALVALAFASPARAEVQDKPWLGIRYELGSIGARVTSVFEESGALASGLRVGDEIFEVDGAPVDPQVGIRELIQKRAIGEKATLRVYRDGRVVTLRPLLSRQLTESELVHTQLVGKRAPTFALLPPTTDPDTPRIADSVLSGKVGLLAWFNTTCRECLSLVNKLDAWVDSRDDDRIVALAGVGGRIRDEDLNVAKALELIVAASPVLVPIGVDGAAYQDYAGFENPAETMTLAVVDQRGFIRMAVALNMYEDNSLDDVYAAVDLLLKRGAQAQDRDASYSSHDARPRRSWGSSERPASVRRR